MKRKSRYLSRAVHLVVKSKIDMDDFFSCILTPAEIDDVILRLEILRMLSNGYTQRDVAKELDVSIYKVSRGAGVLKSSDKKSLQKILG